MKILPHYTSDMFRRDVRSCNATPELKIWSSHFAFATSFERTTLPSKTKGPSFTTTVIPVLLLLGKIDSKMRFALLLLTFSCWIAAVRAGIFEGFAKEMPSLEDIPDIAEQVRKLWDPSSRMMNYASGEEDRHLLQTATATPTSGQTTSGQNIPADFNKQGALSFVVVRSNCLSKFLCESFLL